MNYFFFPSELQTQTDVEIKSSESVTDNEIVLNTTSKRLKSQITIPPVPQGFPNQTDEDIDHLVALHRNRNNSLGSLGVSLRLKMII